MLRRSRVIASVTATVLLASCSSQSSKGQVTLHVLAASSLTEAFTAIGQRFHREHSSVRVAFEFAGSSALVRQLHEGAPADVLATADNSTMQQAVAAGNKVRARQMAKTGLRELARLERDFTAYWPRRNKGTTLKCSPFFS